MLTGGEWQQGAEETRLVLLNYGLRGLLGFTSCEEGEPENAAWTVEVVFPVSDKWSCPKLSIQKPIRFSSPNY